MAVALEKTRRETKLLALMMFATLAVGIITSLFFKEGWLWMDEVLSYTLVSDPSRAHMNDAVVSGLDANPPLFPNVYWTIGRWISLHPDFLRSVSIVIFAGAVALFFIHVTSLVGTPLTNLVVMTLGIVLTYLNFTLSTQIRTYALFLLVSCTYFILLHRLVATPRNYRLLAAHVAVGSLMLLAHNFGLFYLAISGSFFGLLFLWSRRRDYLWVLASYVVIALAWLIFWYPSFQVQADAGKPHSWIPLPTFLTFFRTVGELVPGISARLEYNPYFSFLTVLRVAVVIGIFLNIAVPRLRLGYTACMTDRAFMFYVLSGFIYLGTIVIALVVSFAHVSVFISRYLWPSSLLVLYQLLYAYYHFVDLRVPRRWLRFWPVYAIFLLGFSFYQNRKVVIFPRAVFDYMAQLDPKYPLFVETADYFLPIWFHYPDAKAFYLLDWESASEKGNTLGGTVEHKILKSFREKYGVTSIVPVQDFKAETFPRFYVIDEHAVFNMERFIASGEIKVVRSMPAPRIGHRILECTFAPSITAAGLPSPR